MLTMLYPTYTLKVEVQDRPQAILQAGVGYNQMQGLNVETKRLFSPASTGCDEVLKIVKAALLKADIVGGVTVSFERFEHKP